MIKKILAGLMLGFALTGAFAVITAADTTDIDITSADGYDCSVLHDDSFSTTDYYMADNVITVSSTTAMDYVYIMWDTEPGEWTLTVDGVEETHGQDDFLHELVKLPKASTSVQITIGQDHTYIAEIYGISGDVPDWVQDWNASYEEADILLISTHSDDEILFFGGIIPNYVNGGKWRIQVAYMCDFYKTEPYRRHELLNGLWAMGVTHYPQLGEFEDIYSTDIDTAKTQYDYDAIVEYMVRTIRRFKPQVVVGQDFNGEYGHGGHMICAEAIAAALEITADESQYQSSAAEYGTWDVPKAYFHLYSENQIELDARVPLEDFGGQTALEVATAAYKKHLSQQWMWFYVDDGYDENGDPDGYEYSCTKYGLYRTLVGADTGNDITENITSYDEQERARQETATTADESSQTESMTEDTSSRDMAGVTKVLKTVLVILSVILIAVVIIMIIMLIYASYRKKKEAERRRRRQRQLAQRRRNGSK